MEIHRPLSLKAMNSRLGIQILKEISNFQREVLLKHNDNGYSKGSLFSQPWQNPF